MAAPAWWPTLTVEFQWGYGVSDTWSDTFTDESDRVRSVSVRIGRDDELQQVQTSTATIVLDNRDGALDPSANPDVRPNVRVLVYANVAAAGSYSSTDYGVFAGFIDSIVPTWESAWGETVTIECVDPLALLALRPLTTTRTSEDTDARYQWLANVIQTDGYIKQWDYDNYIVAAQVHPARTYDRTSTLDALLEIVDGEDAVLFVSPQSSGPLMYLYPRYSRTGVDSFVFTDAPSGDYEIEYESVEVDYSTTYLYNDVTVTDENSHTATATSATSIAAYGDRKLDKQIPVDDATEVTRRAEWLANRYGEPMLRVRSVTLRPAPLAASTRVPWHVALSSKFATVTVEGTRPSGAFSQFCMVEGAQHDIDANGDWTITYSTSPLSKAPAVYDVSYWVYDADHYA